MPKLNIWIVPGTVFLACYTGNIGPRLSQTSIRNAHPSCDVFRELWKSIYAVEGTKGEYSASRLRFAARDPSKDRCSNATQNEMIQLPKYTINYIQRQVEEFYCRY